jgi:signal transduction histidine kinase
MERFEVIQQLLRDTPGHPLCDACLASALPEDVTTVQTIAAALARTSDLYERRDAACAGCGRLMTTTAYRPGDRRAHGPCEYGKCTRCSRRIEKTEEATVEHGDLFHTWCWKIQNSASLIARTRKRTGEARERIRESGKRLRLRSGTASADAVEPTIRGGSDIPLDEIPHGGGSVAGVDVSARGAITRRAIQLQELIRSPLARYGFAVAAAGVAVMSRLALDPVWGVKLPLITFYPAVMMSAWVAGFGAGMMTTMLCAVAAGYFWMPPIVSLGASDLTDLIGLLVFVGIGTIMSALNEAWRRMVVAVSESENRLAIALTNEHVARTAAETADRMKDQFLAVLSHELRTPLNTILGWLPALRAGRLDASQQERALETIELNTRAQARMIDDLLDISSIVAGKMTLDRRFMSLGPVVAETVESLQYQAKAKGLILGSEMDSISGPVLADADRMRQVCVNLLVNAIKYTPSGGLVAVRLTVNDSAVRIVVKDTGIGIDADLMPQVFERFRRADWRTAGTRSGLGLGLAIVRQIVEMHGGMVKAESDGLGRGAAFVVTLPIACGATEERPVA